MVKMHLKRKIAPRTWPILRKNTVFITRPKPKGHPLELTLPLVIVMREMLGIAANKKEAQKILKTHEVTINGRRAWKTDDAVGFMDVLAIGKDTYRMTINRNEFLQLEEVKKGNDFVLEQIKGKTTLKGGKTQINCASGKNLIVEKDDYKVGDTLAIKVNKIEKHFELKEGAAVLITGGRHIGKVGNVKEIQDGTITLEADKETIQTASRYAYVVGDKEQAY